MFGFHLENEPGKIALASILYVLNPDYSFQNLALFFSKFFHARILLRFARFLNSRFSRIHDLWLICILDLCFSRIHDVWHTRIADLRSAPIVDLRIARILDLR
jgi:hypothetical protein